MKDKLRVFGYVRVSTENQLENYSIEEQVTRLKAYCSARDWDLLKIYTDGGFSGGNTNRPALKQMLSDLKTSVADAVLVYKLDRLSRSQKDTLTLIEDEFLSNNIDFISINENFDTSSPFGRAMIGILSVFAQLEKDNITERFTMGRIGRGKAGYFHGGGNAPYGYTYENGELTVNETQSRIVKEIYSLFLNGKSINAISAALTDKYGGSWPAAKVRNILINVIYIGKVKFAKEQYDGKHESIIDANTFKSVQKLMFSSEREANKTSAQKTPFRAGYMLSSLIVCGRCGAKYSASHGFYKCYSRSKNSRKFIVDPDCKNNNWKIEELDNLVVTTIYNLADSPLIIEEISSSAINEPKQIDIKKLKRRIKSIETQISNLIDLYQVGGVPIEMLTQKIKSLDLERETIQNKLNTSEGDRENLAAEFLSSMEKFKDSFHDADIDTKRLLIASLIRAVHVDGDDVSMEWRI